MKIVIERGNTKIEATMIDESSVAITNKRFDEANESLVNAETFFLSKEDLSSFIGGLIHLQQKIRKGVEK
jgi:hypothetical protein